MKRLSFKKRWPFFLLQNSILETPLMILSSENQLKILKYIVTKVPRIIISGVSSFFLFTSRQNQARNETVKSAGFMFEIQG